MKKQYRYSNKIAPSDEYIRCLDLVIMSMREHLVTYFKGGGNMVVKDCNVSLRYAPEPHTAHNYQRAEVRMRNRAFIYIGSELILGLRKAPDTITIHLGVVDRSATMRRLKRALLGFVKKYLGNVVIEYDTGGDRSLWRGDRGLILSNRPKPQEDRVGGLKFPGYYKMSLPGGPTYQNWYLLSYVQYQSLIRDGWRIEPVVHSTVTSSSTGITEEITQQVTDHMGGSGATWTTYNDYSIHTIDYLSNEDIEF